MASTRAVRFVTTLRSRRTSRARKSTGRPERARATEAGFSDPDGRAVEVREAVCHLVGWDLIHDTVVDAMDHYDDVMEALEAALAESGYLEVREQLFPTTLPTPD
jgi:hypothetical protein